MPATLTLSPGGTADVGDLTITFVSATDDSRCPINALCIQAGDAVVHLRVRGHGNNLHELHVSDLSRRSVVQGGLRITLTDLQPIPTAGRTTPQEEYRLTLDVTAE